jgi:hypothetical protein
MSFKAKSLETTRLRPGDLLLFYMSKDDRYAASQSITTVGVVEQVIDVITVDDLIRHTAKRSVFSADDLSGMNPSVNSAVKMIDFLLAGHMEPPVRLDALIRDGVFSSRPPRSIADSMLVYGKLAGNADGSATGAFFAMTGAGADCIAA